MPASLTFWKILPHLAMLQRRGVLVPFIGSGMSFPACRFWQPFVVRLAVGLSVPVPDELRNSKKTEEFFSQVENLGIAIPKELKAAQNAKADLLRVLERPEIPLAQQRHGVGHPGIRQTPQDQRRHAERRGPSLPRHVCQLEEDLPQAGGALLGLSARPSSRAGPNPPPRRPDPPESTAEHRLQPPSRARQLKDQRARFTYEKSFQSRGQDEAAPAPTALESGFLRSYRRPTLGCRPTLGVLGLPTLAALGE